MEIECLRSIWSHLMISPSESDTSPGGTLNDLIAVAIDNLHLGYSLSWSFVRDGITSRPPLRVLRAPPPDPSAETGTTPGPGLPFNGGNSVNVGGDAAPFPGDQPVSRSRFLITCLRRVGRPRTFQVGDAIKRIAINKPQTDIQFLKLFGVTKTAELLVCNIAPLVWNEPHNEYVGSFQWLAADNRRNSLRLRCEISLNSTNMIDVSFKLYREWLLRYQRISSCAEWAVLIVNRR